MHVAHVLRKYDPREWGGAETYLDRIYTSLLKQGIRSTFFCPKLNQPITDDPLTKEGHKIERYQTTLPVWGITKEERTQLTALGGNLLSFNIFYKLYRETPLDLIHAHTQLRLGASALWMARLRRVPFVVTIHGWAQTTTNHTTFQPSAGFEWGKCVGAILRSRRLLDCADAIITVNDQEAKLLQEKYPKKIIQSIPGGVDTASYQKDQKEKALHRFAQMRNRRIVLVPCRIDPIKNQQWVVEHISPLIQKYPDILFVFAGGATNAAYHSHLIQQIESQGLKNYFLLTGNLAQKDPVLTGLYQMASAVLLPSTTEPFGLVVLEAWAAKTPILSNRTTGPSQLITHQETGLLYDTPPTYIEGVSTLLDQPDLASRLAQAGYETALSHWESRDKASQVLRLYEQLLNNKYI